MEDAKRIDGYKGLFSKSYIENNDLEGEEITEKDLEVLDDLDPDEVFENLCDLINSLLEFKKIFKLSEQGELLDALKQYEQSNKQLESEIKVLSSERNSLKSLNESLEATIKQIYTESIALNQKISEYEKIIQEKDKEIGGLMRKMHVEKNNSAVNGKIKEKKEIQPRKSNAGSEIYRTPQKRVSGIANLSTSEPNQKAKQMIKSVKFEYYVGPNKALDKTVSFKSINLGIRDSNISQTSRKTKPTHHRSTSDVFLAFKRDN